jgi:anti-sigma regulatory factor (Ser/Thr protein kinase)
MVASVNFCSKVVKELTETREQLKQKQQEINDLNLILSTATTNIAEQAKHLFEEKGIQYNKKHAAFS